MNLRLGFLLVSAWKQFGGLWIRRWILIRSIRRGDVEAPEGGISLTSDLQSFRVSKTAGMDDMFIRLSAMSSKVSDLHTLVKERHAKDMLPSHRDRFRQDTAAELAKVRDFIEVNGRDAVMSLKGLNRKRNTDDIIRRMRREHPELIYESIESVDLMRRSSRDGRRKSRNRSTASYH